MGIVVKENIMKNKFKLFLVILVIFSFGLFFGEFLLDTIINSERDSLNIEIRDSVLTAIIVSLLITVGYKSLKNKK
jgi:hypothetical protein|tara:strand:+ start:1085 stop:1312 length:228 start_codon:yes stop_codon:yes gene_type:complete